jgi:hypothetical protein
MHRTEGDNKDVVGSLNLFKDGPPGTTVEKNFLNAVQEEIAGFIEAHGITLKTASTDTRDQLLAALAKAIITDFTNATHNHSNTVNGGPALIDFKIGTFTRDQAVASGNQAVAGVGFVPRLCIFFAVQQSATEISWGFDDGTLVLSTADIHNVVANSYQTSVVASIAMIQGAGIDYRGVISTFDADGFTIAWTRTGAAAGTTTVHYLAIR